MHPSENLLDDFLNGIFGSSILGLSSNFAFPLHMEVVNMFDDDWEENYGDPLEGLNSNPSCCENELFYFNGKVKQI